MELSIPFQPVGTYRSTKQSLIEVIRDFTSHQYQYGVVVNRFGKVEGFFTSNELLQHCDQAGFEHVEDLESLTTLTKILNKNFVIINHEPSESMEFSQEIELYILQKEKEMIGAIDEHNYLTYVVKQQQFELYHLKTVFNAVPSGIMAVNIEGIITMMNPAAEKISRVSKEMALGKFVTDVVPPKGLLQVLQTSQGHVEKYKVGKRWYISHREPIFDGKQLVGAVGVYDDISKMESLSSELDTFRQLVKENEALIENSEHGIAIVDVNGSILRQNNRFQQLYLSIIYDRKQRMQLFRTLQKVVQLKKLYHYEESIISDGIILSLEFTPIIERETDIIQHIILKVTDITTRQQNEKKIKQLQELLENLLVLEEGQSFIHESKEMNDLIDKIQAIAKVSAPVLINGEIGTGRSTLAKQITLRSERKHEFFFEIDCLGKNYSTLQRLLFGETHTSYELLQIASGGTIYLKNVDYLPFLLQEQLADLLLQHSDEPLQKQSSIAVDVRIIASVSKSLTFTGPTAFSERLYYLFNAISVTIPPLDQRVEDLKRIVQQFVRTLSEKYEYDIILTEEVLDYVVSRKWKHNLLDIQAYIEQFVVTWPHVVMSKEQFNLFLEDNQDDLQKAVVVNQIIPLKQAVLEVEKELIQLVSTQNISYRQMAKILEVNPSTIVRKVKKM